MSTAKPSVEDPILAPASPLIRKTGTAWAWALIACILLGASGVVRAMQERRHQFEKSYKETCPIDLAKLPDQFGSEWRVPLKDKDKNTARKLDDVTLRITGATDHSIKTYANELTGVTLTVLILFGPAEPVLPHTPQYCYPYSGFSPVDVPTIRTIKYSYGADGEGKPIEGKADFLAATYTKPNGRQPIREAVYHSFRLDGQWSPYIGVGRKFPRRNPGIFKVQVQRMVAEGESLEEGDPIDQFLKSFLAAVEAEIKAAADKQAVPTTTTAAR